MLQKDIFYFSYIYFQLHEAQETVIKSDQNISASLLAETGITATALESGSQLQDTINKVGFREYHREDPSMWEIIHKLMQIRGDVFRTCGRTRPWNWVQLSEYKVLKKETSFQT